MSSRVYAEFGSELPVASAVDKWMSEWNPYLMSAGFKPIAQSPTAISYSGRYLTVTAFLLGLVTFPLGILIWIFVKKEQGLTITFEPLEAGSRWVLNGYAYKRVRSQFRRSGFDPIAG